MQVLNNVNYNTLYLDFYQHYFPYNLISVFIIISVHLIIITFLIETIFYSNINLIYSHCIYIFVFVNIIRKSLLLGLNNTIHYFNRQMNEFKIGKKFRIY